MFQSNEFGNRNTTLCPQGCQIARVPPLLAHHIWTEPKKKPAPAEYDPAHCVIHAHRIALDMQGFKCASRAPCRAASLLEVALCAEHSKGGHPEGPLHQVCHQ